MNTARAGESRRPVASANEPQAAEASEESQRRPAADSTEQGLTEAELKQLSELKARDREVRAHEAAHQAVGGQYAGAISFSYQRGPDGAQYAVGGEVSIDVAPVQGDPQATIEKMRVVRAAALAPAQPSGQDRAVAAQAMQTMLQAQVELAASAGEANEQGEGARADTRVNDNGSVPSPATGQKADRTYRSVSAIGSDGAPGFSPITSQYA
ncbi:MAG: hypothetical protein B7X58_02295 [Marinobacter sp. 34-60-7]|nr:MAG: hypothetical protein B7X58_02295 [Marinobacter sp. 34-60-7]